MQALSQLSYTPDTPKRARIIVMRPMLVKLAFRIFAMRVYEIA